MPVDSFATPLPPTQNFFDTLPVIIDLLAYVSYHRYSLAVI